MELALACLRGAQFRDQMGPAVGALLLGSPAMQVWGRRLLPMLHADIDTVRLLRARLALYLRAVLRADRGDCYLSAWCCAVCGSGDYEAALIRAFQGLGAVSRCKACGAEDIIERPHHRITPLWEQAPEHRP